MDANDWKYEQLRKTVDEHDRDIDDLKKFKYSTVEKLKTIFERLKEIEKTNKWVSQSFFYLLFGGVISAVFSLIVWLIQR